MAVAGGYLLNRLLAPAVKLTRSVTWSLTSRSVIQAAGNVLLLAGTSLITEDKAAYVYDFNLNSVKAVASGIDESARRHRGHGSRRGPHGRLRRLPGQREPKENSDDDNLHHPL